ncbi:MAG: UxaA family hydrolase, partial [Propionibacteriaceae bacterium]|nr:UxaA family hydrolase [Propionibacteriaceae bacterium]
MSAAAGPLLWLDPADDVAVALRGLRAGESVAGPAGVLLIGDDVPQGHKVAVRDVAEGAPVHKYGTAIGIAV